jgi:hypothetical protein
MGIATSASAKSGRQVGRRDDRLLFVDLIDRGVVARLDAHQQRWRNQPLASDLRDNLFEHGGRQLAAASSAVRQAREPHCHWIRSLT